MFMKILFVNPRQIFNNRHMTHTPSYFVYSLPPFAKVLVYVFDTCLRLLHPFMPHVTEALWQELPRHANQGTLGQGVGGDVEK